MNKTEFHPGDTFLLERRISYHQPARSAQQYLILDVYQSYYFHPSWNMDGDMTELELTPGYFDIETVLEFIWPAGGGTADGIKFWLGYWDSAAVEVIGEIDWVEFGFAEP